MQAEDQEFVDELSSGKPDSSKIIYICQNNPERVQQIFHSDYSLPLHLACKNAKVLESSDVIIHLIQAYPPAISMPNKFGFLPLHKAMSVATEKHLPSIAILVETDPSTIIALTMEGQTCLHLAITTPRNPCIPILDYLLHCNNQLLTVADNYGQYPIHKIAAKPRIDPEAINLLINTNPFPLSLKDNKG
jgi:hypothetical protein